MSADIKSKFNKKSIFAIFFTLFIALIFVTLGTKASPLYPMQDWVDANCFFTVGRSMALDGKVVYRDIFEQKGPLLYFIYAGISLIWSKSFFGVYIMELLSIWALLLIAYKCLRLYTDSLIPLIVAFPYLTFAITTSEAFTHGGSVEELCLFCMMYSLYVFLRFVRLGEIKKTSFALVGLCVWFIFWIKYTMLGFYIGAFVALGFYSLRKKCFKKYFCACLLALVAFIIASVPILSYFAANNALYDLWYVYFYCNIFVYTKEAPLLSRAWYLLTDMLGAIFRNLGYSWITLLGVIALFRKRNGESALVLSSFFSLLFFTYVGGTSFGYYALPAAVFSFYGVSLLSEIFPKSVSFEMPKRVTAFLSAFLICMLTFGSATCNKNAYLMHYDKEDMPQYKFAKQINEIENATILNYGWVDMGFYYAAEVLPSQKYFCCLNAPVKEMWAEIDRYIYEGEVDFIVSSVLISENLDKDIPYTLVDVQPFYFEGMTHNYFLYKHNSLIK